tara:strand:- start:124 stop:1065 length:942 start_codon:yes stop_codon:yes gene_type:complete
MKKRLALAAAFAFSIIPFTSFADHLEPDESEIKKDGELVRTNLEDYDLFSNKFSDDILIALMANGYVIETNADLSGADLRGVDLVGETIFRVNLSDADLRNAKLSRTDMRYSNFSGADLRGTDLRVAKLNDADFSGANLDKTTRFDKNTDFNRANLSGADLSGRGMIGFKFSRTNLSGADLEGTNLSDADLRVTNLSNADLSGANLSGARFDNTNLSGADLSGADLSGADLRELNLNGANLNGAIFDFDFVTVGKLPFSIDCPRKNQILRIKKNVESGIFVVRYPKVKKKFHFGSNFNEALEAFEQNFKDRCV